MGRINHLMVVKMLKNYYSHGKFEATLGRRVLTKSGIDICLDNVCFATVYPFMKLAVQSFYSNRYFLKDKTVITKNSLILHLSNRIAVMADELPFNKDEFKSIIIIAREIARDVGESLFFSKGYQNLLTVATGNVSIEYDSIMNINRDSKSWSTFFDNKGKEKECSLNPFEERISNISIDGYDDFMFNGMCVKDNDKLTIMSLSEIKQLNDNGMTPKQIINMSHIQHDVSYERGIGVRGDNNSFFIPSGVKVDVDVKTAVKNLILSGKENRYDGSNINIYFSGIILNRIFDIYSTEKYVIMPNVDFIRGEDEDKTHFEVMIDNLSSVYDPDSFMKFFNAVHENSGKLSISVNDRNKASKLFIIAYMMNRFNEADTVDLKKAYKEIKFKGTVEEFRTQWKMFMDIAFINQSAFPCPVGRYEEGIDKLKERIDFACDMLSR